MQAPDHSRVRHIVNFAERLSEMHPQRPTLIDIVQRTVKMLSEQVQQPELLALINVIGTCSNELALRQNSFYVEFLDRGLALFAYGENLLSGKVATTAMPMQDAGVGACSGPDERIGEILARLEMIVRHLDGETDPMAKDFIRRCGAWELELYRFRAQNAPGSQAREEDNKFTRANLQTYLRQKFPDSPDLQVTEFRSLPGGFSKFTTLFEFEDAANGRQEMVARIEPPQRFWDLEGLFVSKEYPIVRLAHAAGIPTAEPLWIEGSTELLGRPFFVSRKAAGSVCGTHSGAAAKLSSDVVRKMAAILADIHRVPVKLDDPLIQASHLAKWLEHESLAANTRAGVEEWAEQLPANASNGSPFLASTVNWLLENAPEDDGAPCLLHGDFGPHNLMMEDGEITALLDWETARVGDPAEDFGHLASSTNETMNMDEFIGFYEEAGGQRLSAYRLRYFDVYDCVQRALACQALLGRIDKNENSNVNWIVYGLRYGYHYAQNIDALISRAEAARIR